MRHRLFNMVRPVHGITHPLIADMYLKKDAVNPENDILVIETIAGRMQKAVNDEEAGGAERIGVTASTMMGKAEKSGVSAHSMPAAVTAAAGVPDNILEPEGQHLEDLLIDLEDIRRQATLQVGSFSRIDIRTS